MAAEQSRLDVVVIGRCWNSSSLVWFGLVWFRLDLVGLVWVGFGFTRVAWWQRAGCCGNWPVLGWNVRTDMLPYTAVLCADLTTLYK